MVEWDLTLADALIAFFLPFVAMAIVAMTLSFMWEFLDRASKRCDKRREWWR